MKDGYVRFSFVFVYQLSPVQQLNLNQWFCLIRVNSNVNNRFSRINCSTSFIAPKNSQHLTKSQIKYSFAYRSQQVVNGKRFLLYSLCADCRQNKQRHKCVSSNTIMHYYGQCYKYSCLIHGIPWKCTPIHHETQKLQSTQMVVLKR